MVEAENIKLHRTADEIKLRRSRSDVTKILAALHARAKKMIKNGKHLHYGDLMNKALNYMLNGWGELQNYRMDGHYTIDNIGSERSVRPVKTKMKVSGQFKTFEGAQAYANLHSVVQTARKKGENPFEALIRIANSLV